MKVAIVLLTVVASVLASPVHHELDVERSLTPFDWDKIEPLNVFIEPIGPAPHVAPGGRIIGGSVVARNSVPYQCFIIINGGSFCGCSIISRLTILSAAHCTISARTVQLVLGAHARNQNEATQQILSPTGLINHANYNNNGQFSNDISLLRLSNQITLTAAVQLIGLASGTATYAGSTAFLSGWGVSNAGSQPAQLHGISLDVITNAVCQQSFGNAIIASTICTSGVRNNAVVGACNGDSGGPLVVGNLQVGVVSFGAAGCVAGRPSAFARVTTFRTWIQQNGGV